MIMSGKGFGQGVSMNQRMPFRRPANAGFYTPQLAPTAFYSHINPFVHTMLPISSFRPNLPRMPQLMRPGYVDGGSDPNAPMPPPGPQMDVTPRPQQIKGFGAAGFGHTGGGFGAAGFRPRFAQMGPGIMGFGANAAVPPVPVPVAPPAPVMQARRYQSPYDSRNPYPARTMRSGGWAYVDPTARGIRQGAAMAAQTINRSHWGTFANRRAITGTIDPRAAY